MGGKNQSAEGELDKLKTLMSPRDHGNARDTSIVLMFKVIHTFDDSFTHNSNDTFFKTVKTISNVSFQTFILLPCYCST